MPERDEHRDEREQTEERGGIEPQPGTAEPMDASAYAASSSESGGVYREEGPTIGDTQGQPVGEGEEADRGLEPADEEIDDREEQPEDRPGVGDVYRSGS